MTYKVKSELKPLHTSMALSMVFAVMIFCLTELTFNLEQLFTIVVYGLLIYSCSAGLVASLATTIRNTPHYHL